MRVLIKNGARPILVMAFTNHAVDHLLRGVLDEKITSKVVRLGGRSADEEIASRSLESLERLEGQSRLKPALGRTHGVIKELEKEMSELMNKITSRYVPSHKVMEMLEYASPDQWESLESPPLWVYELYQEALHEAQDWEVVGGDDHKVRNLFDYWFHGYDLQFLADPVEDTQSIAQSQSHTATHNRFTILKHDPTSGLSSSEVSDQQNDANDEDYSSDEEGILQELGSLTLSGTENWMNQLQAQASTSVGTSQAVLASTAPPSDQDIIDADAEVPSLISREDEFISRFGVSRPTIPTSDRPLHELESTLALWTLSLAERQILGKQWISQTRLQNYEIEREEFERLRGMHRDAQERFNELKDEVFVILIVGSMQSSECTHDMHIPHTLVTSGDSAQSRYCSMYD